MSNTAAANLLMPIVVGMQGVALTPMLVGVAFACSLSMALPISTPPNAIAFGSGALTVGDLVKPGAIITIVGVTLTSTLFFWWWQVVGFF
jgi:sodium-dependent dicarboxylate transporter 2/3/5